MEVYPAAKWEFSTPMFLVQHPLTYIDEESRDVIFAEFIAICEAGP